MSDLLGDDGQRVIEDTKSRYTKVREDRESRSRQTRLLSIEEARRRRETFDWQESVQPAPRFTGLRIFDNYPLEDLIPRIDWTPFFLTWEMRGTYPAILNSPTYGREARTLFRDAKNLLEKMIEQRALTARAVIGFLAREFRWRRRHSVFTVF